MEPGAAVEHNASETNGPGPAVALNQRGAIREFLKPGWRINSTACLIRSNASHIDLPFQFLSTRQCDMDEDNPIASHRKLEVGKVAARLCFFGLGKYRIHSSVRHVGLKRNARARDRFASIGQL